MSVAAPVLATDLSRVLFVDDHHLLLEALTFVVAPQYQVSCIDSLAGLDAAVASFRPNVVVIDISMPDGDGVSSAQRLARRHPDLKLIFLSMHTEASQVRRAVQAGVHGFVSKKASASELLMAIETVLNGGRYQSPELDSPLVEQAGPERILTDRQKEVLLLVARGFSAKEIATDLNISVRTAEFHRSSIMDRLNLHSTALLTRYAVENGLV